MKVKDIIALLQHFDPEKRIHIKVDNDNYTRAYVSHWNGEVYLESLGQPDTREYKRITWIPQEDGPPKSVIQVYQHLRAKTKEESEGDLAAGAITLAEHQENLERIAADAQRAKELEEHQARAAYERLKARFEPQQSH